MGAKVFTWDTHITKSGRNATSSEPSLLSGIHTTTPPRPLQKLVNNLGNTALTSPAMHYYTLHNMPIHKLPITIHGPTACGEHINSLHISKWPRGQLDAHGLSKGLGSSFSPSHPRLGEESFLHLILFRITLLQLQFCRIKLQNTTHVVCQVERCSKHNRTGPALTRDTSLSSFQVMGRVVSWILKFWSVSLVSLSP